MDLYKAEGRSLPQKSLLTLLELLFLALAAWVMFGSAGVFLEELFGWAHAEIPPRRRYVIMGFSIIILMRMMLTMFYFMRRHMPWSEAFSVPIAFALYYVGFAVLVMPSHAPLAALDYFAIALFVFGCYLNTGSELQRHLFKRRPENKGRLFTGGMFAWSMHINFFGDIVWVTAYALITQNTWSVLIVIFILSFFVFFNVPKLDAYLADKYGEDFRQYANRTKRLIPFIW